MAALTVHKILRTGLTKPALVAAAALGDTFVNTEGKTWFRVINAHAAASRTVTFKSYAAVPGQGLEPEDLAVVVPALTEKWIGPFEPLPWNNVDGAIEVTYSTEADLTVGAVKL